jgi:hypothetical protein
MCCLQHCEEHYLDRGVTGYGSRRVFKIKTLNLSFTSSSKGQGTDSQRGQISKFRNEKLSGFFLFLSCYICFWMKNGSYVKDLLRILIND